MNFFPLCTAMVWPIKSGTMVERRDHVLTTFFSLRVFSPSTFSRRWPSTNGPFFSERAIDSLFLHSPQAAPRSPPHLLESPHRTRNAVRFRAERANKPRALGVGNPFHNHRPAGLAELVQNRLRRRRTCFFYYRPRRLAAFYRGALGRALDWPIVAPCCRPACSCRSHCFCSHRAALRSPPGFSPQ